MLAAIQSYGIQPGPRLFDTEPDLVWGLIASLFIGNTALLVLNLPLAPVWARLLRIPRSYLYAGILFFASLGTYAANANTFDLFLLLVIGALGFMMRRYGLPLLPAIIGVILGPYAEEEMRTALQISNGDIGGLIEPMSVLVYVIVALILLFPLIKRLLPKKVAPAVLAEAVHDIEEAHHHHGLTEAVSVETRTTRSKDGPDPV
jgi:putative tricarboxylic transport membrane protein